jgi:hypothetical protein
MMRKLFLKTARIAGSISLIAVGIFLYKANALSSSSESVHTYFSYTKEELQPLETLNSDMVITESEVDHWIKVVFDLAKKNNQEFDTTRVYAYLFTAQQDAAALSFQTKGKLAGNLTAVSTKTLCLLLPDKCGLIPAADAADAYSLKVAEIVTAKVHERLKEEEKTLNSSPSPKIPEDWAKDKTYFGTKIAYQKPWMMTSGSQFRLENPKAYGKNEIKLQLQELKNILASLTNDQLEAAKKWSASSGTILTSGQWLEFANNYMTKHHVPLERGLVIRSILARGIADATIAHFDSKYTYWKLRPKMMFSDLETNIKTPNSPSYPSGHATVAMAAAIIMDHYFPENQAEWDKTAQEIGQSRLWGGVHFPVDDYDGLELGRKIGNWIVKKIGSEKSKD